MFIDFEAELEKKMISQQKTEEAKAFVVSLSGFSEDGKLKQYTAYSTEEIPTKDELLDFVEGMTTIEPGSSFIVELTFLARKK